MAKVDPNKYSKNANIKAESFISVLFAIVRMGLTLVGIVGITFQIFGAKGWLSKLFGEVFKSTTSLILSAVALLVLWFLNRWLSSPSKADSRSLGDIPMYVMMTVGVYYVYRLYSTGSF